MFAKPRARIPRELSSFVPATEGSHVIIEVSDDGAGIAVEKIRQKAIERGVITAERAAQQSDRELLQLIFLPGFPPLPRSPM